MMKINIKSVTPKNRLLTSLVILLAACGDNYTSEQETNPQPWEGNGSGIIVVEPEPVPDGPTSGSFENFMIQSKATTDYCIADKGDTLILAKCDAQSDEQRWTFNAEDGSIKNVSTEMCMQSAGAKDGATLSPEFCNLSLEQTWSFANSIISQEGFAFDVNMQELSFILWTQHGNANQQWIITDKLFVSEEVDSEKLFTEQLLISQGKPDLCLGISNDDDVVMNSCDKSKNEQLWSYTKNGSLINKSNGFCIAQDVGSLKVTSCDASSEQRWDFEGDNFSQAGVSFDVNLTNSTVILWSTHGDANQRWLIVSHAEKFISEYTGGEVQYPINKKDALKNKIEIAKGVLNRITPLSEALPYPRNIIDFPGVVGANEPKISKNITLDRNFYEPTHLGWQQRKHWQSTGLYAAAGDIISVNVKSADPAVIENLSVIINLHTDILNLGVGNAEFNLERFSNVHLNIPLKAGFNELRSQYGGLVVIDSGALPIDAIVDIEIGNVVQAPYYILGETTDQQWQAMQDLDVPWGTMETDNVSLTMSKADMAKVNQPAALMSAYKSGRDDIHDLSGFDSEATSGPHRAPSLRTRIVDDVQISYGFAHAGYPIMASPGWNSYAIQNSSDGHWGTWHEIGHNYQQKCFWMVYGGEVTTNLFPLYFQSKNNITSRLSLEKRYSSAINKIAAAGGSLANFHDLSDPFDRLIFLIQIKDAFEGTGENQGWDIFRQLHRKFRALDTNAQDAVCQSDQASYDKSFEFLSEISGHNLTEHFTVWGVPVSSASLARVAAMELPMPSINISAINKEQ
ncbi:ricin-type beta-trefoil lectin domain protein [Colwellia sp. MB02u-6]|uniref:M60 family metallopeptidase n=1 Tax=Colwellia sp. MB02u-6 TaxID=2759824 RepID=UPI0015F47953|nr:M60 family metallopeptidase [Colwellia sp. MB02u-6]MBA6327581.1 ricin-type beta-trefoil lectin domain protein [Colwellia sp. MB02u-6]